MKSRPPADRAEARATFFRPDDEVRIHEGHLPHWRQAGVLYFITGRLADSMPQEKLHQWQDEREIWLRVHGLASLAALDSLPGKKRHEFHSRFTQQWHRWLDAGYGECVLRLPHIRKIFVEKLMEHDGGRYDLDAWVIMPNHFHALVAPTAAALGGVVQGWKGGSAFTINKALGRSGSLWQKEPFDHIVRSEDQWRHYERYIAENPSKAKLSPGDYAVGIGKVVSASAEILREQLEQYEH